MLWPRCRSIDENSLRFPVPAPNDVAAAAPAAQEIKPLLDMPAMYYPDPLIELSGLHQDIRTVKPYIRSSEAYDDSNRH